MSGAMRYSTLRWAGFALAIVFLLCAVVPESSYGLDIQGFEPTLQSLDQAWRTYLVLNEALNTYVVDQQILFEEWVVKVRLTEGKGSLDWSPLLVSPMGSGQARGLPTGGSGPEGLGAILRADFGDILDHLKSQAHVEVLQTRRWTCSSGTISAITTAQSIPLPETEGGEGSEAKSAKYRDEGTKLVVYPQVYGQDFIRLELRSEMNFVRELRGGPFPVFSKVDLEGSASVRSGETFVVESFTGDTGVLLLLRPHLLPRPGQGTL